MKSIIYIVLSYNIVPRIQSFLGFFFFFYVVRIVLLAAQAEALPKRSVQHPNRHRTSYLTDLERSTAAPCSTQIVHTEKHIRVVLLV